MSRRWPCRSRTETRRVPRPEEARSILVGGQDCAALHVSGTRLILSAGGGWPESERHARNVIEKILSKRSVQTRIASMRQTIVLCYCANSIPPDHGRDGAHDCHHPRPRRQ